MSRATPTDGLIVNHIRQERERLSLGQAELGRLAGIEKVRMHMIESGKAAATPGELGSLSAVLGVPWAAFYPHVQLAWGEAPARVATPPARGPAAQASQLLALLRQRGAQGVTPLEALDIIGSLRLGARVWDLRREGYLIVNLWHTTPAGARVARYVLREESES